MISEYDARATIARLMADTQGGVGAFPLTTDKPEGVIRIVNRSWFTNDVTGKRVYGAILVMVGESVEAVRRDAAKAIDDRWP